MRLWRRSLVLLLAMVFAFAVAACGADDPDPDVGDEPAGEETDEPDAVDGDDEIALPDDFEATITWSAFAGQDHWGTAPDQAFADAIEEASNGQMTVDIHWAGALVGLADHRAAISDGVIDIGVVATPYEPAAFPINNWIASLAFLPDTAPAVGSLQATAASIEWGFGDHVVAEYEAQGLVPLLPSYQTLPTYSLLCKDPVVELGDAQGLRTRIPGPAAVGEVEALGMSAVQLPTPETYEALERGVVDCFLGRERDMRDWGFIEIAQHHMADTEVNFSGFLSFGLYANPAFWESLPVEAQQIIWDALIPYVEAQIDAGIAADTTAIAQGEDEGVTFHQHGDDLRAELTGYHDDVIANINENAPDGVSPDEADEISSAYIDAMERWLSIVRDDLGYGDHPETWEEFVAENPEGEIDLGPYLDRLWDEVLAPRRP